MPEQTLMISRKYLGLTMLAFIAGTAFFSAILAILPTKIGHNIRLFCWSEICILAFGIIFTIWCYSIPRPGLTLDKDGFTVWRYPMKSIRVLWSNVEQIQDICDVQYQSPLGIRFPLFRLLMPNCLTIHVVDSARSKNWLFVYNRSNGLGDAVISCSMLAKSKQELTDMMNEYRKAIL